MADPNSDFSDFLDLYSGHTPTPWDGHICSELDSFYIGPCTQQRDSNTLERCNFEAMTEAVLNVAQHEETEVHRFGHWACGWYEMLLIHPTDTEALKIASRLSASLEQYGSLDDDKLSAMELDEACKTWENWSISDRVYALDRFGLSIFAARRDELPYDPTGELTAYLAE